VVAAGIEPARDSRHAHDSSKHLKDLAIVLHCRVADLLPQTPALDGAKLAARIPEESVDDTPYGTARFKFTSDVEEAPDRGYPITEAQRGYLYRHLDQTR
jgi:hypothetical protein